MGGFNAQGSARTLVWAAAGNAKAIAGNSINAVLSITNAPRTLVFDHHLYVGLLTGFVSEPHPDAKLRCHRLQRHRRLFASRPAARRSLPSRASSQGRRPEARRIDFPELSICKRLRLSRCFNRMHPYSDSATACPLRMKFSTEWNMQRLLTLPCRPPEKDYGLRLLCRAEHAPADRGRSVYSRCRHDCGELRREVAAPPGGWAADRHRLIYRSTGWL